MMLRLYKQYQIGVECGGGGSQDKSQWDQRDVTEKQQFLPPNKNMLSLDESKGIWVDSSGNELVLLFPNDGPIPTAECAGVKLSVTIRGTLIKCVYSTQAVWNIHQINRTEAINNGCFELTSSDPIATYIGVMQVKPIFK